MPKRRTKADLEREQRDILRQLVVFEGWSRRLAYDLTELRIKLQYDLGITTESDEGGAR